MAVRELSSSFARLALSDSRPILTKKAWTPRRYVSEAALQRAINEDLKDLESNSSFEAPALDLEKARAYDPVQRAQARRRELPASRYVVNCTDLSYTDSLDTSTVHQGTIEDHSIPISLLQNQTLRLENLFLAHFLIPVASKRTRQ